LEINAYDPVGKFGKMKILDSNVFTGFYGTSSYKLEVSFKRV